MINEINLPNEAYSVAQLQYLQTNGLLKDHLDAINYVYQYYFEINLIINMKTVIHLI